MKLKFMTIEVIKLENKNSNITRYAFIYSLTTFHKERMFRAIYFDDFLSGQRIGSR